MRQEEDQDERVESRDMSGITVLSRDPTFGDFVPRLGISATFGGKFGELRYLGIF